MSTTKTRGWRTYRFGERVVEIRKLQPKSGISLDEAIQAGLSRGYRYLSEREKKKLLQETVRTPGYLVVPSDRLWTAKVFEVRRGGTVQPTIRNRSWVETSGAQFSVLMAEDES